MKSTSSYLILLVSFIGLLLLQQYENRNNQKVLHEQNQKTKMGRQTTHAINNGLGKWRSRAAVLNQPRFQRRMGLEEIQNQKPDCGANQNQLQMCLL